MNNHLRDLDLQSNYIESVSDIQHLNDFENLVNLNLFNNKVLFDLEGSETKELELSLLSPRIKTLVEEGLKKYENFERQNDNFSK